MESLEQHSKVPNWTECFLCSAVCVFLFYVGWGGLKIKMHINISTKRKKDDNKYTILS